MTLFGLPPSVIWFAVFAFCAIVSGLHLSHIYALGIFEYEKELIKKFHFSAKQARDRANKQIWFNWAMVTGGGAAAAACAIISIINLINGK